MYTQFFILGYLFRFFGFLALAFRYLPLTVHGEGYKAETFFYFFIFTCINYLTLFTQLETESNSAL
jgi:hypothetical protein